MINNTTPGRWGRLKAKTFDAQFCSEMIAGLNCSPFEAEAIIEKVHEVYGCAWFGSLGLKPGQIQVTVVDASVAPNTPLSRAKQRLVTLTLHAASEDRDCRRRYSVPALRQRRMLRVCEEAFQQGGLLTLEDLSMLFNCGVRTLVNDLRALRKQDEVPPLRSTVKDMGRAVTHRRAVIELWLKGLEYSEIARKAHHSVEAVSNYVEKFKRCAALFSSGFNLETTALVVNLSLALTREFAQIHSERQGVAHRLEEVENFVKKNRTPRHPRRNRP